MVGALDMCVFGRMLFEYWLLNFEVQFWMSACSLWGNCQLAKKEVEVELLKRCDGSRHRASLKAYGNKVVVRNSGFLYKYYQRLAATMNCY